MNQQANNPPPIKLFAKQERIYPKRVWGRYRIIKWVVMIVTLGIYYLTPFIRWDRGPNAPDQAVLIDLVNGRAYWFFIEIWPQEVYYLSGILIVAAVMLFFVTSLFGRAWCGYACPQTVWTDLFVWVERIVQGDRNARKKLQEGPWSFDRIKKTTLTHFIWLVIGWCTAGSFVLYFNDAPTLVRSFFDLDVSPTILTFIAALTFSTYIMAGYAREQVCNYMCPYARFQSAMFDENTLIVTYDSERGEPRLKHKKGTSWDGLGHCIDCTACIQVCPMGIDIRDGLQMECISCGLCVDACNNVMDKIDLRRGLIRYDTERHMSFGSTGEKGRFRLNRPRTIYYATTIIITCILMLVALLTRPSIDLTVLHGRNPLFVQLSNGSISNSYELKILNKSFYDRTFSINIMGLPNAEIIIKAAGNIQPNNLPIAADSVGNFNILVKALVKPDLPRDISFFLTEHESKEQDRYDSTFISQKRR